ncbi:MAG: hypothetical protein HQK75_05260 [Candidatus Magnetomorum sp.]|nr:hypothetical protein [Candidatus Magnetomorum sp.]
MKTIILYSLLFLTTVSSVWGGTIPEWEKNALDDLYESTNGVQWLRNDAWEDVDSCQRFGVTCDSDESHVVGLKLFYNHLKGSLPESLGNLTHLQTLLLAGNTLLGELPQSMNQLTALTHLDLSDNQLDQSIFSKLDHLTNLSFLSVSNNFLSGGIPETISNLSALVHLNLSGNSLSGNVPASIWQLSHLIHLNLSDNQLMGEVLADCGSATSVDYLNLSNNTFSGTIPACIGQLTSLSTLYLSNNQFSGAIPDAISQLSQLVYLYLEHNRLEGNIPQTLGSLTELQILRMNHNQLTGQIPEQLGNLDQLIRLDLSNNELSAGIPESLGNLSQLETLYLNNNHLTSTLPVQLSHCNHLKMLFLSSNNIQGPIPDEWLALTSLNDAYSDFRWNALWTQNPSLKTFMDVKQQGSWESTQITPPQSLHSQIDSETSVILSWERPDFLPFDGKYEIFYAHQPDGPFDLFFEVSDMQSQTITLNNIEPCIPYYFRMRTVADPHINNANRVESILSETVFISILSDFPQSEREALIAIYQSTNGNNWTHNSGWIGLTGTECSWYGIECNTDKNHVIGIQLADNDLRGELPQNTQQLTHLVRLDLRANQLSGQIPDGIGTMNALTHLDLSANQFEGILPDSLAQLNNLESLLVYDNHLSGTIPDSLGALTALKRLYLEKNHFTGTIPQNFYRLIHLEKIRIHSNQLIGLIPDTFLQLTSLLEGNSDFRWNGLYSNNSALVTFLNACQRDGADWTSTQTISPADVHAGPSLENGIDLIWTPIAYSIDTGGYKIFKSMSPEGPFNLYYTTADKTMSSLLMSDLETDIPGYFHVQTITHSHDNNKNTLESHFTPTVELIYTLHLPRVSDIIDQTIYQNSSIDISFFVEDDLVPPDNLTVSVISSNTGLIPSDYMSILGTGSERTLRLSSAENHVGSTQLTIIVEKDGLYAQTSFTLTVLAVEKPPPIPTGLSIVSNSGYVRLTWDLIEIPFGVSYRVYRSTGTEGPFRCIHKFPVDMHRILVQDNFIDPNVENGQVYVYKIKSELNHIESLDFSNDVQTTPNSVSTMLGDINGDQMKNLTDLIIALQVIAEIRPQGYVVVYLNSMQNSVGLVDALYLLKYLVQF